MAGLSPRRLTGRALQLSARAGRMPLLGAGVRAVGRPLLGLERLRDARLGAAVPYLAPPQGPVLRADADDAEAAP